MVLAIVVAIIPGCSTGTAGDSDARVSGVYDGIIRWFAGRDADDPDPLPVFIEPRGDGASIDLDVQTSLIAATGDVASVRFIDDRDEALVSQADGSEIVADDGVLISLAPVVERGTTVRLDVDVREGAGQLHGLQFDLELRGDVWVVTRTPVDIPSG